MVAQIHEYDPSMIMKRVTKQKLSQTGFMSMTVSSADKSAESI